MALSASTKLCAVIGNPIGHSLSPLIHNSIYEREGIDAVMLAFQNPLIAELVSAIRALPINLTAVTLPHKEAIIPLLDEVDAKAQAIGSVNTVINTGGKLKGFNTDVVGIAIALKDVELQGKNVLILGAGGGARAVAYHLKERGARIYNYDRTPEKAERLVKSFGGTTLLFSALDSAQFDVIVNATPVGLPPKIDATPIPKEIIQKEATVFDLVYKPLETTLMREARQRGARTISGMVMLLEQALEQERLWLGEKIANPDYPAFLASKIKEAIA